MKVRTLELIFLIVDHSNKTLNLKVVYYGPALSGKTTAILALFSHFGKPEAVERIENTVLRTLFFDYGTLSFQTSEWITKIHVYATTGQDYYAITRPITLEAVDGIIVVLDSQKKVYKRYLASWNELLYLYGESAIDDLPIIIAFNKQDVTYKLKVEPFLEEINAFTFDMVNIKFWIAISGEGILGSFEELLRMIWVKHS
ncbi:MAG: GTP-binding protein [Promethearchaeota archaeon]|jgi:signal recognition particle receptor subunit beta